MLNADLLLKNEVASKKKGKKRKADEDDREAAFHFVAFMTVKDKLWKLDGLERQPMCLGRPTVIVPSFLQSLIMLTTGPTRGDWIKQAKPDIEARMAQYDEDRIEFAILALIKDPVMRLLPALAASAKSIAVLSSRLDEVKPDWRSFMIESINGENTHACDYLTTADASYGLEQQDIDDIALSDPNLIALLSSEKVSDMIAFLQKLITEQATLRTDIREERQSAENDESRAASRSRDYGARMQNFAKKVKLKTNSKVRG